MARINWNIIEWAHKWRCPRSMIKFIAFSIFRRERDSETIWFLSIWCLIGRSFIDFLGIYFFIGLLCAGVSYCYLYLKGACFVSAYAHVTLKFNFLIFNLPMNNFYWNITNNLMVFMGYLKMINDRIFLAYVCLYFLV